MKTLVLANQKGGVGKSAVATQLAFYVAKRGARVLLLDLDHQRNSTMPIALSKRAVQAPFTASELLRKDGMALPAGDFVLVGGDDDLSGLERQADQHNAYANRLSQFLKAHAARFDVCIVDTNPNPDIRYALALILADHVLSPVQLTQEAIGGIGALLTHPRYGMGRIKQQFNAKLELIGMLPNLVEPTPFQKRNFQQLAERYARLLIPTGVAMPGSEHPRFALIPKRTAIAEAQAAGEALFEIRKTSAREAWNEVKPVFDAITQRMSLELPADA